MKISIVTTRGIYMRPSFKCRGHKIRICNVLFSLQGKNQNVDFCLLLLPCRMYRKYSFFTINIHFIWRKVYILWKSFPWKLSKHRKTFSNYLLRQYYWLNIFSVRNEECQSTLITIISSTWCISKKVAGHNPGWFGQCLRW